MLTHIRISTINPLVDIYNSISLRYGLPCGGENIDNFVGDMRLTRVSMGTYTNCPINNTKKFVFTKNDMFNAIVNNKFSEANSKDIKTSYSINYELDQQMEDTDINILFGNLLDNSIESCENLENNKEIILVIDKKRDYILIEVKNTIDKSILKDNPNLQTTKYDKSNHSMGIKSIKKVVGKYEGIINYHEKDNKFSCNILLEKIA